MKLKHIYEFTSAKEWASYVTTYMRKIAAKRQLENGIEVLLVAERGIIGKWSLETNRGYIEEYRGDTRIALDVEKEQSKE